jgi:hypothetical protein
MYVTGQAHCDQQPSSALIPAHVPTRGQAIGELLGWLLGDGLTTARAQAILAAVPAQELLVTAQTGRGPSIGGGFRGLLPSTWGVPTHGGPQG